MATSGKVSQHQDLRQALQDITRKPIFISWVAPLHIIIEFKMRGLSLLLPSLVFATKEQVPFPFLYAHPLNIHVSFPGTCFLKIGDIYSWELGRNHGRHSSDENLRKCSTQQSSLLQIQKHPLCTTISKVFFFKQSHCNYVR